MAAEPCVRLNYWPCFWPYTILFWWRGAEGPAHARFRAKGDSNSSDCSWCLRNTPYSHTERTASPLCQLRGTEGWWKKKSEGEHDMKKLVQNTGWEPAQDTRSSGKQLWSNGQANLLPCPRLSQRPAVTQTYHALSKGTVSAPLVEKVLITDLPE